MARDEFTEATKLALAKRVGFHCSICLKDTSGPHSDPAKAVCIGVAAHITAAEKGGPRYDSSLTRAQRRHATNGIWLCQDHGHLVDTDEKSFPLGFLKQKKAEAEERQRLAVLQQKDAPSGPPVGEFAPRAPGEEEEEKWQDTIDQAKKLIVAGNSASAIKLLESLEATIGSAASQRLRFRLLINKGIAVLNQGGPIEAARLFEAALRLDSSSALAIGNLAQAELFAGNTTHALELANQAIRSDPDLLIGWTVRVQAGPESPTSEIPAKIAESVDFLVATAAAEMKRGEPEKAVATLSLAARKGPSADPRVHLMIAEARVAQFTKSGGKRVSPSPQEFEEAKRSATLAAEAFSKTEETALKLQSHLVLSALCRLTGDADGEREAIAKARETDPSNPRPLMVGADLALRVRDPHLALSLLSEVKQPTPYSRLLRANAAALLGRQQEAAAEIARALETATGTPDEYGIRMISAETAIEAGLTALAGSVLDGLPPESDYDPDVDLLRARLSMRSEDPLLIDYYFSRACNRYRLPERDQVAEEYARHLEEHDFHHRAIEVLTGLVESRSEGGTATLVRALIATRDLERAGQLLDEVEKEAGEETPTWVLRTAGHIALLREDLPRAESYLDRALARDGDDIETLIRRAHLHVRRGEVPAAQSSLARLSALELRPLESAKVAQLCLAARQPTMALALAYRAARGASDDPALQVGYINTFLQQDERTIPRPAKVGPDSLVELEEVGGDGRLRYLVLSRGPVESRLGEFLATDPAIGWLSDAAVGDERIVRQGSPTEKKYRVARIESAYVALFQELLTTFPSRFPNETSLQSFPIGTGETPDLSMVRKVADQRAEMLEHAVREYRARALPIGFLACVAERPIRGAFDHLVRTDGAVVLVESPDPSERQVAMAAATSKVQCVVTLTGLSTLEMLGELRLLEQLFGKRLVSQSLVDALRTELLEAETYLRRGGAKRMLVHRQELVGVEISAEDVGIAVERVSKLLEWVLSNCVIQPLPATAFTEQLDELRATVGADSIDAALIAKDTASPLFADDWGLRRLARSLGPTTGFSSSMLIKVAQIEGILSNETYLDLMAHLACSNHAAIEISGELILRGLARGEYAIDPRTTRLLAVLADSGETAPRVAAAVLRRVALAAPSEALHRVAYAVAERFSQPGASQPRLDAIEAALPTLFCMMPVQHEIVREQLRLVRNIRISGGLLVL